MKLLLLKDVRKLGHLGDVVDVRTGYARNYLLPQRMATEPTDENIAAIAEAKKRATSERAARLKHYQDLADQLKDVSVTIEAAANEEGTLYGSVGAREISTALAESGYTIAPEFIVLDGPIRTLDNRLVRIEFNDDVEAQVKVWVVREGGKQDGQDAEPVESDESESDDEV